MIHETITSAAGASLGWTTTAGWLNHASVLADGNIVFAQGTIVQIAYRGGPVLCKIDCLSRVCHVREHAQSLYVATADGVVREYSMATGEAGSIFRSGASKPIAALHIVDKQLCTVRGDGVAEFWDL